MAEKDSTHEHFGCGFACPHIW